MPIIPTPQPLLTPAEFAEVVRLDIATIYQKLRKGEVKAYQVGRSYRIPHSEVVRFLGPLAAGRLEE